MAKKLEVTLKRSVIGSNRAQRATVRGLGLRRINHTRVPENTPAFAHGPSSLLTSPKSKSAEPGREQKWQTN